MTIQKGKNQKFRRVVLIDDNRATNFLHQCLLEELLLTDEIVVLQNGFQALDFLTRQDKENAVGHNDAPDLILLDVNMPVMNGWELLDELANADRDYLCRNTVVMLTSCTQEQDAARAKLLTVKGYLEKPLDEQKVSELLQTI